MAATEMVLKLMELPYICTYGLNMSVINFKILSGLNLSILD